MRVRRALVGGAALLAAAAGEAPAETRVALVIGNAAYVHAPDLPSTVSDAADVSAALARLGFAVTRLEDAGFEGFRRGLLGFRRAAAAADVAVVFYAGHGFEVDQRNYLVPVDAELTSDLDVDYEAVPLDLVLRAVAGARRLRVVILDACRDNPFVAVMSQAGGTRAIGRGLARVEPAANTLVAYAAKEGTTAADGARRNSPYTAALLDHLEEPGLEITMLFRRVRDAVVSATGARQEPFLYGSPSSEAFYLVPPSEPVPEARREPEAEGFAVEERDEVLVVMSAANVRAGPAEEHPRIGQLDAGSDVRVTGKVRERDWYRIALSKGRVGFISAPLLAAPPVPVAGTSFRDCAECPEMVVVAAGSFMMGTSDAEIADLVSEGGEAEAHAIETPRHQVAIAGPFAVGRYEVTFAEWDACVTAGGCSHQPGDEGWGRGDRPVIDVSWDDAQEYVRWLSARASSAYRLLSEAEWEYAARAGSETRHWWGDAVGEGNANCDGCGSLWDNQQSAPAGSFAANPFGLHDLAGNVWEWVEDCYHDTYSAAPGDGSAWTNGGDCEVRVARGGSWYSYPVNLRPASRGRDDPAARDAYTGFRVARTLAEPY